mmetsp:Transcript_10902/g.28001  ORF Transcript_10902/g.28001 Transcript_10902/m.28001 type:complete len:206 (-) Transcript_10902:752-1369(-)
MLLAHLEDPVWQGNVDVVTNVAPCGVEGHDRLHLEAVEGRHAQELEVRVEVVLARRLRLRHPPPNVHHHPRHARCLEPLQALVQSLWGLEDGVVHAALLLLAPHRVELEHHVHGHLGLGLLAVARHRGARVLRGRLAVFVVGGLLSQLLAFLRGVVLDDFHGNRRAARKEALAGLLQDGRVARALPHRAAQGPRRGARPHLVALR